MVIIVNLLQQKTDSYVYEVTTDSRYSYKVTVPKQYYYKLTNREIEPEELVNKSFMFLLDREPAASILQEFELPIIQRYFPEYEETISQY